MRKRLTMFLCVGLLICAPAAHGQTTYPLIDYVGFAWETGGFPPSNAADVLNIVAVVDDLDPVFGIDLGVDEVTVYLSGLTSTGQIPVGGGFLVVNYVGGSLGIYQDPSMDADYGINPPNATVASTFTNGSLFLGGVLTSFSLFYDTNLGVGSYEGNVTFNAGTGLTDINGIEADGFTFGGVLDFTAASGQIPQGYDLQVDGAVEVRITVAVEEETWSGIKNLYRGK